MLKRPSKKSYLLMTLALSIAFNMIIIGSCSTPVIIIKKSQRSPEALEPVEIVSNKTFQEVDEFGVAILDHSFVPMKPILEDSPKLVPSTQPVARMTQPLVAAETKKAKQALFVEEIVVKKKPNTVRKAKFNFVSHNLDRKPAYVPRAQKEQLKTISKLCLIWSCFLLLILYSLYILDRRIAKARVEKTLAEIYNI